MRYLVKIRLRSHFRLVQKAKKVLNAEEPKPDDPSIVLKVIVIVTIAPQLVLSYGHPVAVKACDAVHISRQPVEPVTIRRCIHFAQNTSRNVWSNLMKRSKFNIQSLRFQIFVPRN
ncbi:hypothetical protein WN48_08777 [Eufriesea mexicana]|nr:hypothetical protein WN48_08777 [Eufriesea mexicana]